jgi:hypothetical protein
MPWGAAIAAAGSIGGALITSSNSPSVSGGGPNYYTPTGLSTADQSWQDLLKQQTGNQQGISNLMPYYQQSLDAMLGTAAPSGYGGYYQDRAGAASQMYSDLSQTMLDQSKANFGTQASLLGAGQQIYNLGLDPQNALYNRTAQQLQDQTGATNSMYGLGSSAAGAGVANQAMSNFNIDWQNNQLSRALQGLQGYTGAAATAGGYGQLATQQASAAPGYTLEAGQLPYQVGMTLAGVPGQAASQYAQGVESGPLASASGIQSQIIPYLNYGTGAQSVPFQAQSQAAGAAGSLFSQGVQSIGSNPQVQSTLGNAFSNYFNPASGSFSGGDFAGSFTSNPYYSGGGNSYGFTLQ